MLLPNLEDSFTLVDYWYLEKPGVFRLHNIETLSEDPSDPEFTYLYSEEDLNKLHPLLSHTLYGLLGLAKKYDESFISGDHIRENLNYLRHGAVSFTDTSGMERNFARIDELQLVEGVEARVHFRGLNIYFNHVVLDGVGVPLVENYSLLATQVLQAELDKRYPGWLDRWHIAQDLQIDKTALYRYLFAHAEAPRHELPDLSFE